MRQRVSIAVGPRRCPLCGGLQVLRSRRQGVFEVLLLPMVLLRPFRCRQCSTRFFGFFFRKRVVPLPEIPKLQDHQAS